MINKKYFYNIAFTICLLYLIGVTFSNDVDKYLHYSIEDNHNHANCLYDCKDSKVKKHLYKSQHSSSNFMLFENQPQQINVNYLVEYSFSIALVAFQSNAP